MDATALWTQQPCGCDCPWLQMPCDGVDPASAYRRTESMLLSQKGPITIAERRTSPFLPPPPLPPPHKATEHINPMAVSSLCAVCCRWMQLEPWPGTHTGLIRPASRSRRLGRAGWESSKRLRIIFVPPRKPSTGETPMNPNLRTTNPDLRTTNPNFCTTNPYLCTAHSNLHTTKEAFCMCDSLTLICIPPRKPFVQVRPTNPILRTTNSNSRTNNEAFYR